MVTGAGRHRGRHRRRFAAEGARIVVAEIDAAAGQAVARDIGGFSSAPMSPTVRRSKTRCRQRFPNTGRSTSSSTTCGWRQDRPRREQDRRAAGTRHRGRLLRPYWAMRAAFPT
ncbi:hypothetical protein I553_3635 [Mycobacterium xenopi 4042]|uniref:Uncharacterized protein n=1 Tax=Mycobacterium xenopi 4042 TaxID=1299334 RepID=X7ZD48_MYCXE|nr:hypothetical protein I553_3635 [Mycobacterium xenopi 4042]